MELEEVEKKDGSMLKKRWISFLNTIFDPWIVTLFVFAILLMFLLANPWDIAGNMKPIVSAIVTLLLSLISGFLGAILMNRWTEITEKKALIARGKTAVRGLKLLYVDIERLNSRVCEYLLRYNNDIEKQNLSPEVVKTYLEEIIGGCVSLGENVLGSIENWTDLVPEADIKTQIGQLTEQKSQINKLSYEIITLNEILNETKGKTSEEIINLRKEVIDKEKELKDANEKLSKLKNTTGLYGYSDAAFGPISIRISEQAVGKAIIPQKKKKCSKCGEIVEEAFYESKSACPKCGGNLDPYFDSISLTPILK